MINFYFDLIDKAQSVIYIADILIKMFCEPSTDNRD